MDIHKFLEVRRTLLTNICSARSHYFRLKREIAELKDTLPANCYIGTYQSNYNYRYFTLGCKTESLKRAKSEGLTKKLHLGTVVNPNYLDGLVGVERSRIRQTKEDTLSGVASNLLATKQLLVDLKKRYLEQVEEDKNFENAVKNAVSERVIN